MQRRAGDQGPVLCTVEPVTGQRVADGGHVDPQLMRASGGRRQAQQRTALRGRQHLVVGVGGLTQGVGLPLQQRALSASYGQINVALCRGGDALAHGPVLPPEIVRVQHGHTSGMDEAGLCHGHNAGSAAVQPVHRMEALAVQVVGHGTGDGGRLLRQRRRMHGNAGRLIDKQQVLILVQDIQREVHRPDVWVFSRQIGYVRRQHISGARHEAYSDGRTIDGDGLPEFQPAEKAAGDAPQVQQQLFYRLTSLRFNDGMGQNTHGRHLLLLLNEISIAEFMGIWYTNFTKRESEGFLWHPRYTSPTCGPTCMKISSRS